MVDISVSGYLVVDSSVSPGVARLGPRKGGRCDFPVQDDGAFCSYACEACHGTLSAGFMRLKHDVDGAHGRPAWQAQRDVVSQSFGHTGGRKGVHYHGRAHS